VRPAVLIVQVYVHFIFGSSQHGRLLSYLLRRISFCACQGHFTYAVKIIVLLLRTLFAVLWDRPFRPRVAIGFRRNHFCSGRTPTTTMPLSTRPILYTKDLQSLGVLSSCRSQCRDIATSSRTNPPFRAVQNTGEMERNNLSLCRAARLTYSSDGPWLQVVHSKAEIPMNVSTLPSCWPGTSLPEPVRRGPMRSSKYPDLPSRAALIRFHNHPAPEVFVVHIPCECGSALGFYPPLGAASVEGV